MCVKTDCSIALIGVYFRSSRGFPPRSLAPSNQEVRSILYTVPSCRTQSYFRYVEESYKLEMGNAQITQLSRAIAVGAEKGIFSLPKGCKFSWL